MQLQRIHLLQNNDLKGSHPIIIDQTGLLHEPAYDGSYATWDAYRQAVNYDQYLVANDSPWFHGQGSEQMARQWFQKELGITFQSETRKVKMHVVQRKLK